MPTVVKSTAIKSIIMCLLITCYTTGAIGETEKCAAPQPHCQALALFHQASNKNQQGQWFEAAELAQQAINNAAIDGILPYTILCLSLSDESYNSTVDFVPCPRQAPYTANALLSQIKQRHPPQPYVFVSFAQASEDTGHANPSSMPKTSALNGWQINDYRQQNKRLITKFMVGNGGETAMSAVELTLTDDAGHQINQTIPHIKAKQVWPQNLSRPEFSPLFTVDLTEKDGFGITNERSK
ncbi:MAG: hypothetical protein ACI8WB_002017 [Phenylobacterium sp.]|jgi:hypothetical protein